MKLKYRAEIDGLRALAVIPVVLFHAGFELFGGGFVGVDVFFVISGYLITTILINELESNRFSFLNFYERRARRILPALFFVMLVCIPFAWLWMMPSQLKDFAQSYVAVSVFASNVFFWMESGYFDTATEEKPMLHTWSLAVEEQYYLLFPILLLLAWRQGKDRVFWLIVVLAAISLAVSEWGWRHDRSANFYLAHARAWELFAGSIAAFIVTKRGVMSNNFLSFVGLIAILFSIFFFDKTTPFPSVYALVPVLGVVLIILFGEKQTYTARILSTKLFVGIGLVSYSAYLWHQPLFAFARIRLAGEPSAFLMGGLSLVALLLAILSWKFVETPFRNKTKYTSRKIYAGSALMLLIFISLGAIGHKLSGFEHRVDQGLLAKISQAEERYSNYENCHFNTGVPQHPIPECVDYLIDDSPSVLLMGDSHLETLGRQIQEQLFAQNVGSYSISYALCPPVTGLYIVSKDSSHQCHEHNTAMLDYAESQGVSTIILVGRFPLYQLGNRYDNEEGGVEKGDISHADTIDRVGTPASWNDKERIDRVSAVYQDQLTKMSKRFNVIVFETVPEVGWTVPDYLSNLTRFDQSCADDCIVSHNYDSHLKRVTVFNDVLDSIESPSLARFKVSDTFCDSLTNKCVAADERGILYRDDDHLSILGASLVVEDFFKSYPASYWTSTQ